MIANFLGANWENHQGFLVRERTLFYFWEKKDAAFCNCLPRDHRQKNASVRLFTELRQQLCGSGLGRKPGSEAGKHLRQGLVNVYWAGAQTQSPGLLLERALRQPQPEFISKIIRGSDSGWGLSPETKMCRETRELCTCGKVKYVLSGYLCKEKWNVKCSNCGL